MEAAVWTILTLDTNLVSFFLWGHFENIFITLCLVVRRLLLAYACNSPPLLSAAGLGSLAAGEHNLF